MRSHRFVALCLFAFCSLVVPLEAQDRKPPYEAVIESDGEYIRSGPGPNFYPTAKLKRGQKVTVHRHDPGGWCMISPPPGSFSWIRAEHVQKSASDPGGVLKANNVVVHVGSSIDTDEFTTIQGNLSKGDAVEILGEKTFSFDDGPKLMYKVSPIRREWRWVTRKSLVPADAIRSEPFPSEPPPRSKKPSGPVADRPELDPDAFAKPISTRPPSRDGDQDDAGLDLPRTEKNLSLSGEGSTTHQASKDARQELNRIDQAFREMIRQDPSTWNLSEIGQQYRTLSQETVSQALGVSLVQRLNAVSRYQKIYDEYADFLKTTVETKQRDAKLAAFQRPQGSPLKDPGGTNLSPTPLSPTPLPVTESNSGSTPVTATPSGGAAETAPLSPQGAFAGAGIVQSLARTFPGGPQFALITPSGKLLAYLQSADGIDLRRFVGNPMGLVGDRKFREDWGADTITVRGLQPVHLRPDR